MKKKAVEIENTILHQRLFEAGQVNQANEIRIKSFSAHTEELTKCKEAINNYQRILANQREALEFEKKERALTAQSLNNEFKCHERTEKSLEHERVQVQNLIGLLNTLDTLRRGDPNNALPDNMGIGTLWLERESMKAKIDEMAVTQKNLEEELQNTRDDLQHKRLLLDDLSGKMKVVPESKPMPPSESEEEKVIKTTVMLAGPSKQRKRARN